MVASALSKVAIVLIFLTMAFASSARADMSPAAIEALRVKVKSGDLEAMHELGYALQQDADPSNDVEGRDLLIRAAEAGKIQSADYLGQAYLYGWHEWSQVDHEANGEEGVRWLRRSAEIAAGDPAAGHIYVLLGDIYSGRFLHGLPYNLPGRDVAEAVKWFRLCAVGNNSDDDLYCQAQLGILLIETPGAEREGLQRLEGAAAFAEPSSMNRLGDVYAVGRAAPQDLALALAWYERSTKWTNRVGVYNDLASDSEVKAKSLKRHMTSEQIARGEELARQFKPRSAP